jgi:hypothetical protein
LEGEGHGEPGEDEVGGVEERVADGLAIAEGAIDQELHGLDGALARMTTMRPATRNARPRFMSGRRP